MKNEMCKAWQEMKEMNFKKTVFVIEKDNWDYCIATFLKDCVTISEWALENSIYWIPIISVDNFYNEWFYILRDYDVVYLVDRTHISIIDKQRLSEQWKNSITKYQQWLIAISDLKTTLDATWKSRNFWR